MKLNRINMKKIPQEQYQYLKDWLFENKKQNEFAILQRIGNIYEKLSWPITALLFNRLIEFKENSNEPKNYTFIEVDATKQLEQYYKALNRLMSSPVFQELTPKKKSSIQDEQRRIYKRLNIK